MVKVSVVMPIYNVEKYLAQCLDSIMAQTHRNLEIIAVVDGATDSSYQIVKTYAQQDARIKVIYQENAGSGPARNTGIDHATGKYIIFVDPDDWVETNMVEDLVADMHAYKVDLVASGCTTVYCDHTDKPIRKEKEAIRELLLYDRQQVREAYLGLYFNSIVTSPTRKLYSSSIIKNNGIRFPDLRRSQDYIFNSRYYNCISSIYVNPNSYYYYRQNADNNLRTKINVDYYNTVLLLREDLYRNISVWGVDLSKSTQAQIDEHFIKRIGYCIESLVINGNNLGYIDRILEDDGVRELARSCLGRLSPSGLLANAIWHKRRGLLIVAFKVKTGIRTSSPALFERLRVIMGRLR